MWRAISYLLPFTAVPTVFIGLGLGGVGTFLTVVWLMGGVSLLDLAVGERRDNPSPALAARLAAATRFRLVLWLWVPTQIGVLIWALDAVAAGGLTAVEFIGLATSCGMLSGSIGITFAHELMHRRGAFDRALAEVLMTLSTYPHFCIEHVHGHHRNVGTPNDPATARQGESLYRFLVRSIFTGVASAWRIEAHRLARRGHGIRGPRNRMLRYAFATAALYLAIGLVFGPWGVAFFALQSLVAVVELEAVNYLEHYGLTRRRLDSGRFETIGPQHSWNSSHLITNLELINLGRHADHHLRAGVPYQVLRHIDEAPQLPYGYGLMIMIAFVPALWFHLMDPAVDAWRRR